MNFLDHSKPTLLPLSFESRQSILEGLSGIFTAAALDAYDEDPFNTTLPSRIRLDSFWMFRQGEKDQRSYSNAVAFYVTQVWKHATFPTFDTYMHALTNSLFEKRFYKEEVRDIIMLFLDQNIEHLKRLHTLDQDWNQGVLPNAVSLSNCFAAPRNMEYIRGTLLENWVLEHWLPFHLKYFRRIEQQAEEDARKQIRSQNNGTPGEPASGTEPAGLAI
jgi:hypothetical protein